ncbi:hypothetical protein [Acinetobacter sp. ANC 4178]|uniref:hypothetical protein n=1 Tax=Acinetobacter sp. ANC 4178 TaxID=2529839 RepID=UPI00103A9F44|nr:hypothetical protein [Acinetobacter sp. ANC 4178]TCB65319.1 hypothetical protein E0H87_12790 [Acinetobacter sp. ANC 4178]
MTLDQRQNSKLLVGIIAGLVVLVAIFLAYQWMSSSQPQHEAEQQVVHTPAKPVVKEAVPVVENAASTAVANTTAEAPIQLVDEAILKQDVPKNASLAKEEIAKLDDIQTQLDEQEKTLKAQHADADDLIALKEEQVKLLEAQLAKAQ